MFTICLYAIGILLHSNSYSIASTTRIPNLIEQAVSSQAFEDSVAASQTSFIPFQPMIFECSRSYHLPPSLVAAVIQEESRFDPWAERAEPRYALRRAVKRNAIDWLRSHSGGPSLSTELNARSRSMGLMQVMGEVAREQGFDAPFLSALFAPENSLHQGCKLLRRLLDRYPHDTLAAISAYNQGSARRSKLRADHRGDHNFLNARYVYRVMIAWRAYREAFALVNAETHESVNHAGGSHE